VELLIALQSITAKSGEVMKPGWVLQAKSPERLLSTGKARRLTHEENRRILDAYVGEAERVFSECTTNEVLPKRKAHIQEALI
jgi:hypothetical protein